MLTENDLFVSLESLDALPCFCGSTSRMLFSSSFPGGVEAFPSTYSVTHSRYNNSKAINCWLLTVEKGSLDREVIYVWHCHCNGDVEQRGGRGGGGLGLSRDICRLERHAETTTFFSCSFFAFCMHGSMAVGGKRLCSQIRKHFFLKLSVFSMSLL